MKPQIYSRQVLDALSTGNIREANVLMGSAYQIHAVVVRGNQLGRRLGYPTANLKLLKNKPFLLAHGVYAVKVDYNKAEYNGMANAGIRPTLGGKTLVVEINLFDFSENLYGKTLIVYFIDRIRDEKKFNSLDELAAQIHFDKQLALKLLS
ncbi:MAG: riboflavin kinase [Bacteroidota bacterium]